MPARLIDADYLHCTRGSSDKVYELFLDETDEGIYVVRANYGRRGSVLKPVEKYRGRSGAEARAIYHDVYNEKLAKGYRVKPIETQALRDTVLNELDGQGDPMYEAEDELLTDELHKLAKTTKKKAPAKAKPKPPVVKTDRNITLGEL